MKFSFRLNFLWSALLALVCVAPIFAKSDMPPLGVDGIISTVAPRSPVRENSDRAPSGLARDDAFSLATSVAAQSGRDITISRVQATGSMRPFFDENSLLLLEAAPFDQLKVGDVVTYYHPSIKQVVAHRLVEKRGDKFWSRGDHNTGMDNVYVTKENYQRRLVGVIYMEPGKAPAAVPNPAMIAQAETQVKPAKVTATPKAVIPATVPATPKK